MNALLLLFLSVPSLGFVQVPALRKWAQPGATGRRAAGAAGAGAAAGPALLSRPDKNIGGLSLELQARYGKRRASRRRRNGDAWGLQMGAAGAGGAGAPQQQQQQQQQPGEGEADGGKGKGWRQRLLVAMTSALTQWRVRVMYACLFVNMILRPKSGQAQQLREQLQQKGQADRLASRGKPKLTLKQRLKKNALLFPSAFFFLMMAIRPLTMAHTTTVVRQEVPWSQFIHRAGEKGTKGVGDVEVMPSGQVLFELDGQPSFARPVALSEYSLRELRKGGSKITAKDAPPSITGSLALLLPVMYIAGMLYVQRRSMSEGVGNAGKQAKQARAGPQLTFDDVAGIGQAKEEVREVVSILRDPTPYLDAGARLPSGLMMVGPPGTGKTLLARVMAAEAGVPFYYCSGSDFVEMYVGRGAARLRKLFTKAAKDTPCLLFIDEVDALGKQRNRRGGGNDEADQTLNQLLASMDGLETSNNGVICIAATNRYDILDEALTRPGRFDRIVRVPLPDQQGRTEILRIHSRKMSLAEDPEVLLPLVAATTPGTSGAELAAICNEAAIRAARRREVLVTTEDFEGAVANFFSSRLKGGVFEGLVKKMML